MQLWVIQTKLRNEDSSVFLIDAFQKLGLNWAATPVMPFQHHIPDFNWDGPIVYYGSTGLVKRVFDNPEYKRKARLFYDPVKQSVSSYSPKLGKDHLNWNSAYYTVEEILGSKPVVLFCERDNDYVQIWGADDSVLFCKPDAGGKSFAGKVDSLKNIKVELGHLVKNEMIGLKDVIVINRPITIIKEYRTWIIDGKVSAVVGYKKNNKVKSWYPDDYEKMTIEEYAKEQAAKLSERISTSDTGMEAFVLDVGETPQGLKVIEINDIHASGFYLTDHIFDIVYDLSNYVAKNPTTEPETCF